MASVEIAVKTIRIANNVHDAERFLNLLDGAVTTTHGLMKLGNDPHRAMRAAENVVGVAQSVSKAGPDGFKGLSASVEAAEKAGVGILKVGDEGLPKALAQTNYISGIAKAAPSQTVLIEDATKIWKKIDTYPSVWTDVATAGRKYDATGGATVLASTATLVDKGVPGVESTLKSAAKMAPAQGKGHKFVLDKGASIATKHGDRYEVNSLWNAEDVTIFRNGAPTLKKFQPDIWLDAKTPAGAKVGRITLEMKHVQSLNSGKHNMMQVEKAGQWLKDGLGRADNSKALGTGFVVKQGTPIQPGIAKRADDLGVAILDDSGKLLNNPKLPPGATAWWETYGNLG